MIVLHGIWKFVENSPNQSCFFIWAESKSDTIKKKRGRPPKSKQSLPPFHTYHLSEGEV